MSTTPGTLVGALFNGPHRLPPPRVLMNLSRASWAEHLRARGEAPTTQLLAVPIALGAWLREGRRVVHLSAGAVAQLSTAPVPSALPAPRPFAVELALQHSLHVDSMRRRWRDGTVDDVPVLLAGWLVWLDADAGWSAIPHLLAADTGGEQAAHAAAPIALQALLPDLQAHPQQDLRLLVAALVALCDERVAEVRRAPRGESRTQRARLQRSSRGAPRWEHLTLLPEYGAVLRAMAAQGPRPARAPAGQPAAPVGPAAARAAPAPHTVRPTEAIVWVLHPRPGEQVVATRTRSLGTLVVRGAEVGQRTSTLHAVRRPRAGHTRGDGAPRPRLQSLQAVGELDD